MCHAARTPPPLIYQVAVYCADAVLEIVKLSRKVEVSVRYWLFFESSLPVLCMYFALSLVPDTWAECTKRFLFKIIKAGPIRSQHVTWPHCGTMEP